MEELDGMKISKAIEILEAMLKEHGDLPLLKMHYEENGEFEEVGVHGISPLSNDGPVYGILIMDSDEVDTFADFEDEECSENA